MGFMSLLGAGVEEEEEEPSCRSQPQQVLNWIIPECRAYIHGLSWGLGDTVVSPNPHLLMCFETPGCMVRFLSGYVVCQGNMNPLSF